MGVAECEWASTERSKTSATTPLVRTPGEALAVTYPFERPPVGIALTGHAAAVCGMPGLARGWKSFSGKTVSRYDQHTYENNRR